MISRVSRHQEYSNWRARPVGSLKSLKIQFRPDSPAMLQTRQWRNDDRWRRPASPARGPYRYRGVIREQGILACANGRVSFRYRRAETGKSEKRSLTGAEFLWRIPRHLLPKGFRRARNFGPLHANGKRLIALLHRLLKFDPSRFKPPRKERPPMLCSCCGAVMAIVRTRIRSPASGVSAVTPVVALAIRSCKPRPQRCPAVSGPSVSPS